MFITSFSLLPSIPPFPLPSFRSPFLARFLPSVPSNTRFIVTSNTCITEHQTKKTITVFDVGGVGIRDLAGDAFDFLRRSIHLISEHYPERSVSQGARERGSEGGLDQWYMQADTYTHDDSTLYSLTPILAFSSLPPSLLPLCRLTVPPAGDYDC